MKAISNYLAKTPIKFKDITNNSTFLKKLMNLLTRRKQENEIFTDWILFKHHDHNTNSYVGRIGGEQIINIADWAEVGNIMHEIMHALGFLHEHSRVDRDRYVSFNEDENPSVDKSNFDIEGYPIGDYDPNSLMHYPLCKYMVSNHPEAAKMGQRIDFSEGDLKAITYVYSDPKCTFDHFGNSYHVQTYYECITSWGENSCYGVCIYCFYHCHDGHDLKKRDYTLVAKGKTVFVCDCGKYGHKIQKMPEKA